MAKRGSLTTACILVALLLIPYSMSDEFEGGTERRYDINSPDSYGDSNFYNDVSVEDWNMQYARDHFADIPSDKKDDFLQREYNNPELSIDIPETATLDGDTLTVGGNTIDIGSFGSGTHSIDASGDTVLIDGNEVIGADNVHLVDDVVTIDNVDYFSSDAVSIANGVNVRVLGDGSIEADRAELIRLGSDGFAGTVQDFSGLQKRFWVENAGVVNNGCLQAFNASNAEFSLEQDTTTMKASSQTINVNDCGNVLAFSASTNATFTATREPTQYLITNANLTYEDEEFVEWVQATQGALVIMDEYSGFSCMTIMPGGAYYYSSKTDKRMDFSIESPSYGIDYRLCIRKDSSQSFTTFDGIIDLAGNNNILDGTVNYHRYPLRNNALAGVVLEPTYQAFLNPKARMQLDVLNVYITNMTVIPHPSDKTVSKTTASNYISIKESPGSKGRNTRAWTKINPTLEKEELTDNLVLNYNDMSITRNVMMHKNTRILHPEHGLINEILD